LGVIMGFVDSIKGFGKYLECKHNPLLISGLTKMKKEQVLKEVFKKLRLIAKNNKCFFVRVSPLIKDDEDYLALYQAMNAQKSPVHPQDALISQYFDTTKELAQLHSEMNKSSRSNANKLLKDKDIKVKVFTDDSVFQIFKDFYTETRDYKKYRGKSADKLLKEFEKYLEKDMLYFLVAYNQGKPVTVWQMIRFGKYMHHYQAGSDLQYNEKCTRLLFYKTLELCKDIGVETLDLFGGMLPESSELNSSNPWKGVNDFKISLGGKKITYMHPRDIVIKGYYSIYFPYAKLRVNLKGHTTDW